MASLKDKTLSGIFWSFLQQGGAKSVQLVTTIILARILTPRDFGLVGMLTIFIAVSETLVQAGFNQALIQKREVDEEDYSSVFWINLVTSIVIYMILFFVAPFIADFYSEPILTSMTRVLSLLFIVNAFSYVQEARLRREIKFRTLMFVHLPSTLFSAIIAIGMALLDYGVWSIVGMQLSMRLAYAIQIWLYAKWRPLWTFNKKKAKKLFSFGGNLMISGIIHAIYDNAYLIIIGKMFPASTLGFYQNAKKMVETPSFTISGVVKNVTFSSFSIVQDDNDKLRRGYKKVVQQLLFWLCPLYILAAVLAEPLFLFVFGEKWLPAVPFFQILCIVGIFYPLNSFNLDIVKVKGRSDIFLRLEIIKKIIITAGILIAIPIGIWALVIFQGLNMFISFYINSYFSSRYIDYPIRKQLWDITPIVVLSMIIGTGIFFLDHLLLTLPTVLRIVIGFVVGGGVYIGVAHKASISSYLEFKKVVGRKLFKRFPS